MGRDPAEMTVDELEGDIEWMQTYFDECARIGQGINTKESVRMRRLKAELESRLAAA